MMTGKIEKSEMLAMLVRAEECAEKADALYKQMYNFIWEEHEKGKSDIAEEDWNGIVRPLEGQAYSYMEKALGDILEIMEADRDGRADNHDRLTEAALLVLTPK